jgi:hypothetical protein
MCFIRLYNRLAHLRQSFTVEQSKGMPCNQVLAATTGMRPYFRELHEPSSECAYVLLDLNLCSSNVELHFTLNPVCQFFYLIFFVIALTK